MRQQGGAGTAYETREKERMAMKMIWRLVPLMVAVAVISGAFAGRLSAAPRVPKEVTGMITARLTPIVLRLPEEDLPAPRTCYDLGSGMAYRTLRGRYGDEVIRFMVSQGYFSVAERTMTGRNMTGTGPCTKTDTMLYYTPKLRPVLKPASSLGSREYNLTIATRAFRDIRAVNSSDEGTTLAIKFTYTVKAVFHYDELRRLIHDIERWPQPDKTYGGRILARRDKFGDWDADPYGFCLEENNPSCK